MNHVERAMELRRTASPHYNCCQAVVIPFAESLGLDREVIFRTAVEFQRRFREQAGAMDCADLLRAAKERGEEKKPHCDRMVALAVGLVEALTAWA